jgi:hypothetical protein
MLGEDDVLQQALVVINQLNRLQLKVADIRQILHPLRILLRSYKHVFLFVPV